MPPYYVGDGKLFRDSENKKALTNIVREFYRFRTGMMGQQYTADHSPDRVSLLHKGGCPICNSGCSDSIVDRFLRPPGKLPVPVALNALSLTLFTLTIHDFTGNVNRLFIDISRTILILFVTATRIIFGSSYVTEQYPGGVTILDQPGTNWLRALARPDSVASFSPISCCFRRFSQPLQRTMIPLNILREDGQCNARS